MERQEFIELMAGAIHRKEGDTHHRYSVFQVLTGRDDLEEEDYTETGIVFTNKLNAYLEEIGLVDVTVPQERVCGFIDWSNYKYTTNEKGKQLAFMSLNDLYELVLPQLEVAKKSTTLYRLEDRAGDGIFDSAYKAAFIHICEELIKVYQQKEMFEEVPKIEDLMKKSEDYKHYLHQVVIIAKNLGVKIRSEYLFLFGPPDESMVTGDPTKEPVLSSIFEQCYSHTNPLDWAFAFNSKADLFRFIKDSKIEPHFKEVGANIICMKVDSAFLLKSDTQAVYKKGHETISYNAPLILRKEAEPSEHCSL